MIFFTGAVFAVMFPKVVASKARGSSTDVLAAALGATSLLGGIMAFAGDLARAPQLFGEKRDRAHDRMSAAAEALVVVEDDGDGVLDGRDDHAAARRPA